MRPPNRTASGYDSPMERTEAEYLTTRELAVLLRIKERKVYDLASSGDIPCTRATGKLLFPKREVDAWLARHGNGLAAPADTHRPEVMLGSHDPLLDWALKASGCGLASFFDGSLDGLNRFRAGDGLAAGIHLFDRATGNWNVDTVARHFAGQPVVLVEFCWRDRGLIVGADPDSEIRGIEDLRGRRVVPRQAQAGSQILLLQLLETAGIAADEIDFSGTAHTETDAATAVLEGAADAALGLATLARRYRLGFVPLMRERFDLLVDRRAWFDPPFQTFLRFCESPAFREHAASLEGYDVKGLGSVHFNG